MIINRLNSVFVAIFIPLTYSFLEFICQFMLTIDNYLGVNCNENRHIALVYRIGRLGLRFKSQKKQLNSKNHSLIKKVGQHR